MQFWRIRNNNKNLKTAKIRKRDIFYYKPLIQTQSIRKSKKNYIFLKPICFDFQAVPLKWNPTKKISCENEKQDREEREREQLLSYLQPSQQLYIVFFIMQKKLILKKTTYFFRYYDDDDDVIQMP